MTNALLTPTEVARIIPWSKNYLLGQCKKGNGPTSIVLSPRKIRFLYDDVLEWLETRRIETKKVGV